MMLMYVPVQDTALVTACRAECSFCYVMQHRVETQKMVLT